MRRRIEGSWLSAFQQWTLPRSEAPASMIFWAGLFTIASAVKRKVWFPRNLLGSYEIYPSLYVVFVARPGVARKSTTAGYAEDLLRGISKLMNGEHIAFAADITSHSKLLDALANSPDNSLTVISSEFSSLLQTTPEAMYELLTHLFDNKATFDWSTWSHGEKKIVNPVVNLLAATTPAWISAQPPEYFLGGGFASRVLFIFESQRRQYRMYYDDVDYRQVKDLEDKLIHDLNQITTIRGEFSHDSRSTRNYCEAWYQDHARKEATDSRLQDYLERKHVHAHKIAMLLSLAERDDRKITKAHWDEAVRLLEEIEGKLPRAYSSLGKNPLGPQMDAVLEYISDREGATKKQLAARFYRDLSLEQLTSVLAFLIAAGKVKQSGQAGNPKFEVL